MYIRTREMLFSTVGYFFNGTKRSHVASEDGIFKRNLSHTVPIDGRLPTFTYDILLDIILSFTS
jgi:hypothetical protein